MKNIRCILIDDDADDRQLFELALKRLPYNITFHAAPSGKDGLELIKQLSSLPDFIFLDYNMPAMTGPECLKEIKQDEDSLSIPVIMYSTSTNLMYEEIAKDLHASHYMVKPIRVKALMNILGEIFEGKQLPFILKEEDSV